MQLPIADDLRAEKFDAVFIDWIGGPDVWQMLIARGRGLSYREVAEMHGVSTMTARSWILAARAKLRRVGFNVDAMTPEVAI